MSVQNPERVVTKQDLADFYDELLPFISPKSYAGFTPIGTIIPMIAESAPANYLICNGATYNKSDYPELAAHLLSMTSHSMYEVSGDATKFKVPDLRGEFLRGTGANGHSGQGDGSTVGTHQDATQVPNTSYSYTGKTSVTKLTTTSATAYVTNYDTLNGTVAGQITSSAGTSATSSGTNAYFTVRPTNTSVLFCIATKNIYLDPKNDYSTEEKVIGAWINGETLYQKTLVGTISVDTDKTSKNTTIGNVSEDLDTVVSIDGIRVHENKSVFVSLSVSSALTNNSTYVCNLFVNNSTGNLVLEDNRLADDGRTIIATVQYTKATS